MKTYNIIVYPINMFFRKIENNLLIIKSARMDNNSYILINDKKAIIIDPSFLDEEIINNLKKKYEIIAILLTHAHFDHCFNISKILNVINCPIYMHKLEKDTYEKYNYANWIGETLDKFDKNIKYFSNNNLKIANYNIKIILTPGHTSGSVTYYWNNYLFTGDTLFIYGYGRTDLVNSNENAIIKSLKYILSNFNDNDIVLPGHGEYEKLSYIKKNNLPVLGLIKKDV